MTLNNIPAFRADLHCHTHCSDGLLSPEEIIHLAKRQNLQGLAITDHDTIIAYNLAKKTADEEGIKLLPGVEFSAVLMGVSVHVLAYAFNPNDPNVAKFCQSHQQRRHERNARILHKLEKLGIHISSEELEKLGRGGIIGRPHIAQLMIKQNVVSTLQEAFDRYLGEGKSAYDSGDGVSVEETLDVIHGAKGLAVIAHPHLILKRKVERQLIEMPFDGVEGYYGGWPYSEQRRWHEIASRRNWFLTGGSDFHGEGVRKVSLGASWVSEDIFNMLDAKYRENL